MHLRFRFVLFCLLSLVVILPGCQTTYYTVWEKLGKEKRHLLKDNVEKQRVEQEKASEEFKDALTRVKEIYGFKGGDLEDFYNKLKDDYENCEDRAGSVAKRIEQVERIATDLFAEWETEINEMENQKFKAKSRQSLADTKKRYTRLHQSMLNAHSSMTPVLQQLKDYVLYLKHNLNAQAVGALKQEAEDIEAEVAKLIKDINTSIKEADAFLKNFG